MCETMQQLEEDRIQFVRDSVWRLANVGSETCVKVDDSREEIRAVTELVDIGADIREFVAQKTTCIVPLAKVVYEPYGQQTAPAAPATPGTLESQYSFADKKRHNTAASIGNMDGEYAEIHDSAYSTVAGGGGSDSRRGSNHSWGSSSSTVVVSTVMYRALYDYHSKSPDEISVLVDDQIQVTSGGATEPGWLRGLNKRTNMSGLVPENYVEKL